MKKFLGNGRKLLRKILIFLGVASISLVFQACYGMPEGYHTGGEDCECYDCWQERNQPENTENPEK